MRAGALVGWVALGLTACGAGDPADGPLESQARPVIGGAVDDGDDAVVAVLLENPAGDLLAMCSGSLISKRVVLSAAHCADAASGAARWEVYFGVLSGGGDIHFIDQIAVVDTVVHPRWKPADLGAGHDLSLLLLARDAPVTPLAINRSALGAADAGKPVRLVGFGNLVPDLGAGQKRTGATVLQSVNENLVIYGSDSVNTCQGDSGGPEFMDLGAGEVVVGVTSYGPEGCTDYGAGARVDVFAAAFIDPWVAAKDVAGCLGGDGCVEGCTPHDPDCAPSADGEPCNAAGECAGGVCLPAPDQADVHYCTGSCDPAGHDCPAGMDCVAVSGGGAAVCVTPTPSPRALGAACASDTDCQGDLCVAILGESRCTAYCQDGFPACRPGFSCTAAGADHVCALGASGGGGGGWCAVASGRGAGGRGWVVLVLAAMIVVGRRRR